METEDSGPVLTLKERIAALQLAQNSDKNFPSKAQPHALRPRTIKSQPPPLPKRTGSALVSPVGRTSQPVCKAPNDCTEDAAPAGRQRHSNGRLPPLPPRREPSQDSTAEIPPALPPRRPTLGHATGSISPPPPTGSFGRRGYGAISENSPSVDSPPALPRRRASPIRTLPPPSAVRRIDPAPAPPPPSSRSQANSVYAPNPTRPRSPESSPYSSNAMSEPPELIIELDANTFDRVIIHSGKPSFVDFYAPFCKYCKELDPVYEELALKYQNDNITIAKIDSYGQKVIGERYEVQGWPTLYFFDGTGAPPVKFEWMRDMEWMSKFIDLQMSMLPVTESGPPPIPMASRPVF